MGFYEEFLVLKQMAEMIIGYLSRKRRIPSFPGMEDKEGRDRGGKGKGHSFSVSRMDLLISLEREHITLSQN